jgi:hypothetical protein
MKMKVLFSAALLALPLFTAQADPRSDVTAAAQKLASESSYSWNTTVVVPTQTRYRPGPSEGKIQKDGLTYLKVTMRNNAYQMMMRGTNIIVDDPDPDGGWQTLADFTANDDQGPGRFLGMMMHNFKTPADQALNTLSDVTDLQETNGAYAGALTEDGAKKMLAFRRGGNANTVTNSSGTASFWISNGELSKFEVHVKGTVTFNDNDVQVDRDMTVEIKDVGTTTITVPSDAKKLLP